MMFFAQSDNSDALTELVCQLDTQAGSIRIYRQVYSVIFFTQVHDRYVFVPEGRSPIWVGLKHTLISLTFGPWSWIGPFLTLFAVMTNMSGGTDISSFLKDAYQPGFVPTSVLQEEAARKEKALSWSFVAILYGILGYIIWAMVIPVFDPEIWTPDFVIFCLFGLVLALVIGLIGYGSKR